MQPKLIQRKLSEMTRAILELVDIRKEYNNTGLDSVEVFSNVNLSLLKGEMVGLFSPSGAGKTTLQQIADAILPQCCDSFRTAPTFGFLSCSVDAVPMCFL